MAMLYIYIYKKQYQKCSVYHSLSKVSHIKVFPMLLLKKSLYGFGHVFSVRTPHDRPRTQFDHSSCLRFFYLWYPMRFGVHKKATSISTCLSCFELLTQQISKSIAFLSCVFSPDWFALVFLEPFVQILTGTRQNITFPTGSEACEASGTRRYWKRLLAPMLCAVLEDCYGCAHWVRAMDVPLSPLMELLNKWTYNYTVP